MSQYSSKLRKVKGGYCHWCPGYEERHFIAVEEPQPNNAKWSFDGNGEQPTFNQSINISWYDGNKVLDRCHYFIKQGQIQFLSDCTHKLSGQTVELLALPGVYQDE